MSQQAEVEGGRRRSANTSNVLSFLQLRAAPDQLVSVQYGYKLIDREDAENQARGRRDWASTLLLCVILVTISSTFGSVGRSSSIIDIDFSLCGDTNETLARADELFRSDVTNYTAAVKTADLAANMLRDANETALEWYTDDAFSWPEPYYLEGDEEQLKTMEAELQKKCLGPQKCAETKGIQLIDLYKGRSSDWRCVQPEITCDGHDELQKQLAEATSPGVSSLLSAIDQVKHTENQLLSEMDELKHAAIHNATNKTAEEIDKLLDSINLASSIYIYYLALCLLVGSAFLPLSPNLKDRLLGLLQVVNKPLFVLIFIVGFYIARYARVLLGSFELQWAFNIMKLSPCWLEGDFLTGIVTQVAEVCEEISDAGYHFYSTNRTWHYLSLVEKSWNLHDNNWYRQSNLFPNSGGSFNSLTFDYTCNPADVLRDVGAAAITPETNWFRVLYDTGAFVSLLLPLVLAEFSISCFRVFVNPLIVHRGKILVPSSSADTLRQDHDFERRVKTFLRAGSIVPFIVWSILLVFLIINFSDIHNGLDPDMARYTEVALAAILVTNATAVILFSMTILRRCGGQRNNEQKMAIDLESASVYGAERTTHVVVEEEEE